MEAALKVIYYPPFLQNFEPISISTQHKQFFEHTAILWLLHASAIPKGLGLQRH
jgi:hypothetical protein